MNTLGMIRSTLLIHLDFVILTLLQMLQIQLPGLLVEAVVELATTQFSKSGLKTN